MIFTDICLRPDPGCLHCWVMGAIAGFGDGAPVPSREIVAALAGAIAQVLAASPDPRRADEEIAGLSARVAALADRFRCVAARSGSALQ
jgi:hypothetical protein